MKDIVCVIGTRPESVKMAPVVIELRHRGMGCQVVCTGQHRDLNREALQAFSLIPDVDLGLMTVGQTPTEVASRILQTLPEILDHARPDCVLVQGDTTTALAAALAAFHAQIPIGHVEAGLRTHRAREPFPEEMNRRVIDAVADLAFAPTARARDNLLREGIAPERIVVTGNTAVDAVLYAAAQDPTPAFRDIAQRVGHKRLVLITAHRRESFGEPHRNIFAAVRNLAALYRQTHQFVLPVHPNPQVKALAGKVLSDCEGVLMTEPVDHLTMVHLLKRAHLVLTDSGGIQEEAPTFGVPSWCFGTSPTGRRPAKPGWRRSLAPTQPVLFPTPDAC